MNIDKFVNKFLIASRELFNNSFLESFLENEDWEFYELFACVEEELFNAFFDWDQSSYKDNRFVRAIVKFWP
jgi:hypothetical protein